MKYMMTQSSFFFFVLKFFLHLNLHCVTITNSVSSFSRSGQGSQTAAEFSMRRATTSGKSGVVRRRRDGSWSVVCEVGLGVDIGERFIVHPQAYLLIGGAIADGGFRLILRLHT